MPEHLPPLPDLPGTWARIIFLVIILVFVIVMTTLGFSPDAAAGIGAASVAAVCFAAAGGPPSAEG